MSRWATGRSKLIVGPILVCRPPTEQANFIHDQSFSALSFNATWWCHTVHSTDGRTVVCMEDLSARMYLKKTEGTQNII